VRLLTPEVVVPHGQADATAAADGIVVSTDTVDDACVTHVEPQVFNERRRGDDKPHAPGAADEAIVLTARAVDRACATIEGERCIANDTV
jgi:hypothetical protein